MHPHARLRVTEQANPLTASLDVLPPLGLVRALGSSDAQLFSGAHGLPGLSDGL